MAEDKPITESMHMTIVAALEPEQGGELPAGVKVMQRNALVKRGLVREDGGKFLVTDAGRKAVGAPALESEPAPKKRGRPKKSEQKAAAPTETPAEPTLDEVAAEANEDARLADQAAHEVELSKAERVVEIDPATVNGNGKAHGPASLPQAVRDALSSIQNGRMGSQARNIAAQCRQRDGEQDTRYVGRLRHELYVHGSTAGGDALQLVPA